MDWLTDFPTLDDNFLRVLKKTIDENFRAFTRAWGDSIEAFFDPLQHFLIQSERMMIATPWPIVLLAIALLAFAIACAAVVLIAASNVTPA